MAQIIRHLLIFLVIGSFLLFTRTVWADSLQVDYYLPANILRFADHLYDDGDYVRAAGEYLRYLFYSPEKADSITYKIGLCYRLGGGISNAIEFFQKIPDEHTQSSLLPSAHYEIAYSYYLMEKYKLSVSHVNGNINNIKKATDRLRLKRLVGFCYLKEKRWSDAASVFDSLAKVASDDESRESLLKSKRYAEEGKNLSRKSSIMAGVLSAVFPGMGKVYCKRYKEALSSFIVIGINGWQAYDGFHEKGRNSTKGWIFATVGGIFYLGNIYGSTVAAHIYNQQLEKNLLAKIEVEINFNNP